MTKTNDRQSMIQFKTALKIMGISAGLMLASSVQALRFEPADEFSIDFDTTLAYGAMWRIEERDEGMMGPRDGDGGAGIGWWGYGPGPDGIYGTSFADPNRVDDNTGVASTSPQFIDAVLAWNADDGNRNFEKGDLVSNRVAMLNDFDFRYRDYGLFFRTQIFYDAVYFEETSWDMEGWDHWGVINNDGTPFDSLNFDTNPSCGGATCATPFQIESDNNAYAAHEISDPSHFSDKTKDINGYNARFLDAFVYGTFRFGDRTLDLRVGRQTISWGEALMLQGGIGFAQNRIDANAATSPGVELKEIFLPTGSVYGQFDLSETLTLEAYWQYEWQASELFGTGSYFSGQDFLNSDVFLLNTEFRNNCSYDHDARYSVVNFACDDASPYTTFLPAGMGEEHYITSIHNGMTKSADAEPDHQSDQFGLALRKLLDNGSEMGVFFIQYHDKYPSLWAMNKGAKDTFLERPTDAFGDSDPISIGAGIDNTEAVGVNSNKYTIEYKERIKLLGLTYNTVFNDIQMGFEFAYRPNQPVVPACTDEMLEAGTTDSSFFVDPVNPTDHEKYLRGLTYQSDCKDRSARMLMVGLYNSAVEVPDSSPNNLPANEKSSKLLAWPAQAELLTANWGVTLVVPPSPLWDTGIFVAELGGFYVGREYTGSGNFIGEFGSNFHDEDLKVTSIGSFTQSGYGVSAIFLPQYKNVVEGIDLTIPVFVNYGIEGSFAYYNYTEGALWFSLGLEAVYLSNTRVGITYSTFGGDHMWKDRDNVAVTAKYTF